MGDNEANRQRRRTQVGTMLRQRIAAGQFEGNRAVFARLTGAFFRAVLIALLVAMPSLLLSGVAPDTAQIVIILAMLSAGLVFVEYFGKSPSIIEFRFAPPYNRLRFGALAATVLILSLIMRGTTEPNALNILLSYAGTQVGLALDFPYSPVRLTLLMLPETTSVANVATVRMAAGVAYGMSIVMLLVFLVIVRLFWWPVRRRAFNVWINLPLFDPTGGGDVLNKLGRDSSVNISLGFLLPFLVPAGIKAASGLVDIQSILSPQPLIWTMCIWAFVPATMIMRGIAMNRISELIRAKRRRAYAQADADGLQTA